MFVCFVRDAAKRAYPSQVSPQLTYFSRHGGSVCLARTGPPETLVGASLFVSELRLRERLLLQARLLAASEARELRILLLYNLLVFGVWPRIVLHAGQVLLV